MSKRRGGRGSKYSDEFKRRLVSESHAGGVSVPMVAKKHGVGRNRIYAWRSDTRFQPEALADTGFIPVEIAGGDHDAAAVLAEVQPTVVSQIEITLENGRKLSVSDGADADFVLELARGLAELRPRNRTF